MANSKISKNELTVKIIPSLVKDDAHTYHMLAYCTGKRGLIYTENGYSKVIQLPTVKNNWRHVFDEVAKLAFNDTQQCVAYNIHIWLKLKEDQHWVSWPTSYNSEIENNLLNHRILFGNHFYLTISPEMDSNKNQQQKQQMVDGKTGPTNSDKKWPMIDENDKYNFKTYTKRSTMVVFNSEGRQCTDSNTYRIKVWAVHKQLLYFNPSGPPLLNYVCKSNGNNERRHISFLNQFDLQIVPTIPKDDDNIYYLETHCHNKGNEHQTFKSVTSGGVKILLHKFACKSYDITVRKVPKNWTQQIELVM
ncbi:hypothetical protein niasHT_002920 [Heterodera trifolii]|uniref:Uncharacterized protein n=1 Tax=Heterodera trifolii TaxID=157864 RepID=A0ABD2LNY9_9BILA